MIKGDSRETHEAMRKCSKEESSTLPNVERSRKKQICKTILSESKSGAELWKRSWRAKWLKDFTFEYRKLANLDKTCSVCSEEFQ